MAVCDNGSTNPGTNTGTSPGGLASVEAVNKFEAKSYTKNDKIKYSFSYGDYDFYYIYLGELKNIPLFYFPAEHHNGVNSTYKVSSTETTKEDITKTVTESSQTTIGVVDTHAESTTKGVKLSQEIKSTFSAIAVKTEAKLAAEENWSRYISDTSNKEFRQTTSLTDTITHGTSRASSITIERSWTFNKDDKDGYYRYTLFSASDVYLYVIKDSNAPEKVYCEFRECVIPDAYAWVLDYSETQSFRKNDNTGFEFDVSMLSNLPKPELTLSSISLAKQLADLQSNAQSYNNYTLEITADETIAPQTLYFPGKNNINIRLTGVGGNRILSLSSNGSMFTINDGVALVLESNITLQGRSNNNASLVKVNSGGTLSMNNGATITGNTVTGSSGGGVYIDKNGSFTMAGGEISGNTAAKGGGVYIVDGIFIKTGGTIASYASNTTNGNRATEINSGHAIYAFDNYSASGPNPYPTFSILRKETTAGPGVNLSFNGSNSAYSGAGDKIIRPKGTL
jgi:hypothetical protein